MFHYIKSYMKFEAMFSPSFYSTEFYRLFTDADMKVTLIIDFSLEKLHFFKV